MSFSEDYSAWINDRRTARDERTSTASTDDAHRDRLAEPERTAAGQYDVSNVKFVRIAPTERFQIRRFDFHDRDVAIRVVPDFARVDDSTIRQVNKN